MLAEPTVFVIGAGAGPDIGMPVGSKLGDSLIRKLSITFEGEIQGGDPEIKEILRRISTPDASLSAWEAAGQAVASGIRYTKSIDEFLHIHKDDERMKACAKLAIAQTILEQERRNATPRCSSRTQPNGWRSGDKVIGSWLVALLRVLGEGVVTSGNRSEVFKNLTIINFNYDRCVEHFLYNGLQDLFRIGRTKAAELMQTLRIYHPYGVVGSLDWQQGNRLIPWRTTR